MEKFTTALNTKEVDIDGDVYVISELSGKNREIYVDELSSRLVLDKAGKPTENVKNRKGIMALLMSLSLRKSSDKENVMTQVIVNWRADSVEGLFKMSQKMSSLSDDKDTKEKLKNG